MNIEEIKQTVKGRYGKCVEAGGRKEPCCCPSEAPTDLSFAAEHGLYGREELSLVPETALTLSKGCGNPTGFANLKSGEAVVDFGCGAGIDVILAARKVGSSGKVIGVDFTTQMIERAKQAVAEAGLTDAVELLVCDMEQLELRDELADVVMSNCVINLCPDKEAVYREAFRILKSGGRLAISDIVYTEKIDPQVQEHFQSTWAGCVGGTLERDKYFEIVQKAGFRQVDVVAIHPLLSNELEAMVCCPGPEFTPPPAKEDISVVQGKVISIKFTAVKPLIS
ncbi:MAG: methyltransferase domain-containing protein [Proteobacteria bacterium]|nr:methyltransferase domain-containing protein [Pseudomonadota bacterium]